MNKFLSLFAATLISVCAFASKDVVPSDAVLAEYYNAGDVCVCIFVPADMACNDVVLTGSFNGWKSSTTECIPFEAVDGYDGWYVASFEPEAEPDAEKGIQAKPIMTDVDGNFSWDYQIGAATAIRGGVQVVQGAYAGEIDLINYGADAPNVYIVDAWKSPCTIPISTPQTAPANPQHAESEVLAMYCNHYAENNLHFETLGWGTDNWETLDIEGTNVKYTTKMTWDMMTNWDAKAYNLSKYAIFHFDVWVPFAAIIKVTFEALDHGSGGSGWKRGIPFNLNEGWNTIDCPLALFTEEAPYDWRDIKYSAFEGYLYQDGTSAEGNPFAFANLYFWNYNIPTNVSPENTGYVNIAYNYIETSAILTATPNEGYHFVQWSDGVTENPRIITMTQDTTFTAEFAINSYKVSVTCDSTRGSVEGPQGEIEYMTELTYTATPDYGYHFEYWDWGTNTDHISVSEAEDIAYTLQPNGYVSSGIYVITGYVIGRYTQLDNSYYISDNPNGGSNCIIYNYDLSAKVGQKVALKGVIGNYYEWYGVAIIIVNENNYSSNNPLTLSVTKDMTLEAVFAPNNYALNGYGSNGYISGLGSFDYLTKCTIEAIPDYGYHFAQWSDGVTDNPRTITLTQDTTFTAEFAADTNGQCGDNLVWVLTDNVLTIIGSGDMWDGQPWVASRESISAINLPEGLTSVGAEAFYNCRAVTSLSIPKNVVYIGERALRYMDNLEVLEGPFIALQSMTSYNLKSITVTAGEICNFSYITNWRDLEKVDLKAASCYSIPEYAFSGYRNLKELVLPSNLERIEYMAVGQCLELKEITIPASVQTIDKRAFEDCRSIKTLTFEEGSQLETIGSWAFYNCHNIVSVEIPEGVTEIGDAAFYGCTYLADVKLPASVQALGDNAFALCSKMKRMDVDALLPPAIEAKTFEDVSRQMPVYVPDESVDLYKSDALWGEMNIIGQHGAPQGLDQTTNDQLPITNKILRDGQILILRGDKTYTVTGQEVR